MGLSSKKGLEDRASLQMEMGSARQGRALAADPGPRESQGMLGKRRSLAYALLVAWVA